MNATSEAQATPSTPDPRDGIVRAPATVFQDAPEVEALAERVIRDWHPHLAGSRIRYLWREGGAWSSGGRTVLAKAGKLSTQVQFLADDFDAVIIVDTERWQELDGKQRLALVDHECCHLQHAVNKDDVPVFQVNGRPLLKVVRHDVEEFVEIIQRHGLWDIDLVHAGKAIKQLPMDFADKPADDVPLTITGPDGQSVQTTTGELGRVADMVQHRGRRRRGGAE